MLKTAGMTVAVLQRVQCGEGYTVAATTDGDLLLWGRRSKSSASSDDCLAPTDSSDIVDTADDTSRHLDICSPTQLTVEPLVSKGHRRQPSNTSISSGTAADDTSAMKNAGIYFDDNFFFKFVLGRTAEYCSPNACVFVCMFTRISQKLCIQNKLY